MINFHFLFSARNPHDRRLLQWRLAKRMDWSSVDDALVVALVLQLVEMMHLKLNWDTIIYRFSWSGFVQICCRNTIIILMLFATNHSQTFYWILGERIVNQVNALNMVNNISTNLYRNKFQFIQDPVSRNPNFFGDDRITEKSSGVCRPQKHQPDNDKVDNVNRLYISLFLKRNFKNILFDLLSKAFILCTMRTVALHSRTLM